MAHWMPATVPFVEVADDGDAFGIRRPDREMDAACPFVLDQMGAQLVEEPEMRALGDIVIVHRAQHRAERVGIGDPPLAAGIGGAVFDRLPVLQAQFAFEETRLSPRPQRAARRSFQREGFDRASMRDEAAGDETFSGGMDAEDSERIAMRAGHDRFDVAGGCPACITGRRCPGGPPSHMPRLPPLPGMLHVARCSSIKRARSRSPAHTA